MLKAELEKAYAKEQMEAIRLRGLIKDMCKRAVIELEPCDEGLRFIDNVLMEAGLPERTTRKEITVAIDVPISIESNCDDEANYAIYIKGYKIPREDFEILTID